MSGLGRYFRQNIKGAVALIATAGFLLSLIVVSAVQLYVVKKEMRQMLAEQQLAFVERVADEFDQKLLTNLNFLDAGTRTIPPEAYGDVARLQTWAAQRQGLRSIFSRILVVSPKGVILADSPPEGRSGLDVSDRAYFRTVIASLKPYISDPFIGRVTENPTVSFAAPVIAKNGDLVAVLVGVLDLMKPNFLGNMAEARVGKSGSYKVVSRDRTIVIDRDKMLLMKKGPAPGEANFFDAAVSGATGSGFGVDSSGREGLYSYSQLESVPWAVIAFLPIEEADAPIVAAQRSIAQFMLLLSVLFALATWFGVRGLLEPLQSALGSTEKRLAATLNSIGDAVIATDAQGIVTHMNPTAERMTGWPLAEASGHPLPVVFHIVNAKTRERVVNPVGLVMERGQVVGLANHTALIARNGVEYQISDSAAPIRDPAGQITGVVLVFSDVTEQYRMQKALRESEAIVNASDDAIISKNLQGNIVSWYPGAERMFGYKADEVIGKSMLLIVPPDRASEEFDILTRIAKGEKIEHFETVRMAKDGHLIDISATISPILDDEGRVVGASKIARNIAGRKKVEAARASLEAQLRESHKMQAIGTLAGGIAHDFNNILATILGNAELMRHDKGDESAVEEGLEEVVKAARRGRDLVRQILSFSRRQPTERKPVDVAAVATEAARLLRSTISARISLQVNIEPGIPRVMGDATQIEQVLINLATNAVQAIGNPAGRIEIRLDAPVLDDALLGTNPVLRELSARLQGRMVRVVVEDTGPGMSAETLTRIFEPFFTTKAVDEGTGLGLAVVHGIVESHEGKILVESRLGKGTTFSIFLPADVSVAEYNAEQERELSGGADAGHRILYIDDDASLVRLVKRLLERHGCRVSAHADQEEALAALREAPGSFDLVVTDYNMPGMSGLDVARAVRDIRADLPVAVTSGFIDEELRANAAAAGVKEMILKTDAVEGLYPAVRRLIEASRAA